MIPVSLPVDTSMVLISKSGIALFSSYHIQKNLRKLDLWPWGHLLQLRGEKWRQLKPNHEIQDSENELKNKSNKKVNRWFDWKPSMYFIQEAFQRWTDQNKLLSSSFCYFEKATKCCIKNDWKSY